MMIIWWYCRQWQNCREVFYFYSNIRENSCWLQGWFFIIIFLFMCVCVCECLSFSVWIEWKWVGIWKVIVLVDLNAHKWESSLDFYYFIKFLPSFFACVLMNSQRDLISIWISFVWLWFARGIIDYFELTCDNLSSMKIFESPREIAG